MNGTGGERVGAMLNPLHLGELIRESMDEVGWNVTETAAHLGCERGTLSRLLNGKAGVSANMALALEALAGVPPITGCGCRRAMSLREREGSADGGRTFGRAMRSRGNAMDLDSVPVAAGHRPMDGRPVTSTGSE